MTIGSNDKSIVFKVRFKMRFFACQFFKNIINGLTGKFHRHHSAVEHILSENPGKVFSNNQMDVVGLK